MTLRQRVCVPKLNHSLFFVFFSQQLSNISSAAKNQKPKLLRYRIDFLIKINANILQNKFISLGLRKKNLLILPMLVTLVIGKEEYNEINKFWGLGVGAKVDRNNDIKKLHNHHHESQYVVTFVH